MVVNFATGVAIDQSGGTDSLIDIEEVDGTDYDDTLTGGNVLNDDMESFIGNGGKDTIDGGSGFDIVWYSREAGFRAFWPIWLRGRSSTGRAIQIRS